MKIKINKKWSITDLPLNRLLTNGFEVIKRGVIKLNNIIGDDDVEIPFTPRYAYWDKDIYRFAYRVLEEPVLYKSILSKMPKELRDSLVCWYSPNLQGLTNAELFNSNNEYIGGLHDLSGNGHDMTLHGFLGVEGDGHVDADGNLVFDGLNDYANNSLKIDITNATFVYRGTFGYNIYTIQSYDQANLNASGFMVGGVTYTGSTIRYCGVIYAGRSVLPSDESVNIVIVDRNGYILNNNKRVSKSHSVTSLSSSGFRFSNSAKTIRDFIIFDRTLTDEEIDWVNTNMLVSQEPSKRNVTLWLVDEESGSFDKFKTIKVQDGNMIGKYDEDDNLVLPIYDVDAIHQTSLQWYTDVECTEEYGGEYITEDTFLYAKKVKTSDNMLAQLDNVVLEDGTTAREHLVCWYSPKWQGLTKESVLADATLADLSGNGYDATLVDFTDEMEIINADGNLVMNSGARAYAAIPNTKLQDWTIIVSQTTSVVNGSGFCYGADKASSSSSTDRYLFLHNKSYSANRNAQSFTSSNVMSNKSLIVATPSFVDYDGTREVTALSAIQYNGVYHMRGVLHYNFNGIRKADVIFDTTLSDIAIEQVKQILKLN